MAEIKGVPVYKLYGEQEPWLTPEMVHCESIAARSRLHNWHIKPHQHNGLFQILYLQRGSARIQLDDQPSVMRAGHVLMIPQICVHGFQFDENAVGYVLTLAYPLVSKLTRQMGEALAALTKPSMHLLGDDRESSHIRLAFNAFDDEYRTTSAYRELLMEALLSAILVWLTRHAMQAFPAHSRDAAKGSRHFARYCELLEEGYGRHYSVAHYAGQIGITAAHLNLLCRQTVDKSALEMIHERVMLEAKRNLVYTSMSISEVSYAIGFSDPAYFTRFFKRGAGVSPKEFRKQAGT